ncbi:hypothetical protein METBISCDRAFT_21082 [Metschnikowia bicuspidata]|uniref:Uncharacterized protein n=1 Tax=Metschnikowia bicuspidata TaxID=27322 RepID=A0A4V1J3P9_9ASCO|nr:hypothetical protein METBISCDRAFT_21082 [Metschnikowia bicuspidata]
MKSSLNIFCAQHKINLVHTVDYANFSATLMAQIRRQTRTPSWVHSPSTQLLKNLQHLNSQQPVSGQPQGSSSDANIHRRQLQEFYIHKLFDSISDAEFLPFIPGAPQPVYGKFSDALLKQSLGMDMGLGISDRTIDNLTSYNVPEMRKGMKNVNEEKQRFNSYGHMGINNSLNHPQNSYMRPHSQYDNGQKQRIGGHFLQQHLFSAKRQGYPQYRQELQG